MKPMIPRQLTSLCIIARKNTRLTSNSVYDCVSAEKRQGALHSLPLKTCLCDLFVRVRNKKIAIIENVSVKRGLLRINNKHKL